MDSNTDYLLKLRGIIQNSAQTVVPLAVELFEPHSVVDFGCGTGDWLLTFQNLGISDIQGIDSPKARNLDPELNGKVLFRDLAEDIKPWRTFDLAVCVEVGEHLPARCAPRLVKTLTEFAPAVLFSAAIPGQGGYDHINEQWPGYWVHLFQKHGYRAFDCMRERIWWNDRVSWWYSQNLLVFCDPETTALLEKKGLTPFAGNPDRLRRIHPKCYEDLEWNKRALAFYLEVSEVIPQGSRFLLVDADLLPKTDIGRDRPALRFLRQDGKEAGLPESAETAIRWFEAARNQGVEWLVFAWPLFWMQDQWNTVRAYFKESAMAVRTNERVRILRWHLKPE